MIFIHYADNHLSILDADRDMLGKLHIKHIQNIEVKDNEDWVSVATPHVAGKQVVFSMPSHQSYVRYFEIPNDITDTAIHKSVLDKAHMAVPVSVDELAYDMKVIHVSPENGARTVLFAAAQNMVVAIYNQLRMSRATPIFSVPSSLALFEVIKNTIQDNDHILLVQAGATETSFTIFNSFGPVSETHEKSTIDKPYGVALKMLNTIVNRYGETIKGVIISGKHHEKELIKYFAASAIPVIDLGRQIQAKLSGTELQLPSTNIPVLSLAHVLGLVLLSGHKDGINIIKQESLARLPSTSAVAPNAEGGLFMSRSIANKFMRSSSLSPLSIPIIAVVVAVLVIGATVMVLSQRQSPEQTPEPEFHAPVIADDSPTPIPPSPSPTAAIDRATFDIQVLNGNGSVGVGSKASTYLKGLGYKKIQTGNADSYDYENTEIQIKENLQQFAPALMADLAKNYRLASEAGILEEKSPFDAVIIIGRN